jgi:hypothetical protein
MRPVSVRPVGNDRYAIELRDAMGNARSIVITVEWVASTRTWLGHIEGYSMREQPAYDTRPMVGLAIAMHRAIHFQWSDPTRSDSSPPAAG